MTRILLDRNENQYGPAPSCYEILRSANLEQLSLYSRSYVSGRKSELSARLSADFHIPEERILLSYGSEDMLKQVVHCYLHHDEAILLPRHSWWYYKSVAKEVFGREIQYAIRERDGRFEHDVDEILSLYDQHRPKIILIASPNNPTGNTLSRDALRRIVEHCAESVIVLDEAYYGFTEERNGDPAKLLEAHGRLLVLRTFSKYYALAGLRIGYAFAGADLRQLIAFSARYLGFNQLSERIALAALDEPAYYAGIAQAMREDLQAYLQELGAIEGMVAFPSSANFLLVRYPQQLKVPLKSGLEERGIVVKFLDDPGLTDCIRITIGTKDQNSAVRKAFHDVCVGTLGLAYSPSETVQNS